MQLAFDDRTVRITTCSSCGLNFEHVTGFLNNHDGAYAVYFAACHGHPGHEAQIDVVLGTWAADEPGGDHVTFSCRLRPEGASLDDAPLATTSDSTLLGDRLTRVEALRHPMVGNFWTVIDFLATSDPTIEHSVSGASGA